MDAILVVMEGKPKTPEECVITAVLNSVDEGLNHVRIYGGFIFDVLNYRHVFVPERLDRVEQYRGLCI